MVGDLIKRLAAVDRYEGRALSADSLHALISFLGANSVFRYPTLTATPGGDLYAQWKQGGERLLSIHFLPTDEARFVIFKPNPRHPGHTEHLAGKTTTDTLMDTIVPYGVLDWVTE